MSWSGDDRFALARIIVDADMDASALGHLLTGDGLQLGRGGERLTTAGWRVARRTSRAVRRALGRS
jgi:hypothetical protein